MEKYLVQSQMDKDGNVTVRRVSDGKTAVCKLRWLEVAVSDGSGTVTFEAKSKTKALRLDGLEWTKGA